MQKESGNGIFIETKWRSLDFTIEVLCMPSMYTGGQPGRRITCDLRWMISFSTIGSMTMTMVPGHSYHR